MERPQQTASRLAIRLDGFWDFALDSHDRGLDEGWWRTPLRDPTLMPVPGSFVELVPGGDGHVGPVWYQRDIVAPFDAPAHRWILRFDAATHQAGAWWDDVPLGGHTGGYTPFQFEVSHLLRAGQTHRLTVRVDNRLTRHTIPPGHLTDDPVRQWFYHDFRNDAGLIRSVWLLRTPRDHIGDVRVRALLDENARDRGYLEYQVTIGGPHVEELDPRWVEINVLDHLGSTVASERGTKGRFIVAPVQPWSPESPYLYTVQVRYAPPGAPTPDIYEVSTGFRSIRVRDTQLLLNGTPIRLRGFGMHEDSAWHGRGHDDVRALHDLQLLRWTGANSFRTSHYPYAEETLDLADRLGLLVIDEVAAVGLNLSLNAGHVPVEDTRTFRTGGVDEQTCAAHVAAVRELIARDGHHPCVIIWSLANEPDTREAAARPYFAEVVAAAREADPTRPIGFANFAQATPELDTATDLFDLIMLNRYYGWYVSLGDLDSARRLLDDELRRWIAMYRKPIIVTEFGADALPGCHDTDARPWSEEFQRDLIETYLDLLDGLPEVVGAHVWNFADFATPVGLHRAGGNRKGVFTRDRRPKLAAWALRGRWAREQSTPDQEFPRST